MTTFACAECERTVRTDWEAVTCASDAPTCDPCHDLYGHADLAEGERPMTATEGCVDAPHNHVDLCHQAGRAEVEAKYAALVAAVEGLTADLTEEVDELRADIPPVGPSRVAHVYRAAGLSDARDRLGAVLADLADPAEGGDR